MPILHHDIDSVWGIDQRTKPVTADHPYDQHFHHNDQISAEESRRFSSFLLGGKKKFNFGDLEILKRMMVEANHSSQEGQHLLLEKEREVRMAYHDLMGSMLSAKEKVRPVCHDWALHRALFKNPDKVEVHESCVAKTPEEIQMHLKPTGDEAAEGAGKVGDTAQNTANAAEHPSDTVGNAASKVGDEAGKVENAVEHPEETTENAAKTSKEAGENAVGPANADEEYEKVQNECAAFTNMKICLYNKKCEVRHNEYYKDEPRPDGGPTLLEQAQMEEERNKIQGIGMAEKPVDPPEILHECEAAQGHMKLVVALGRKIYGCYEGCATKQSANGMDDKATPCDYKCHKTLQCIQHLSGFKGGAWEDKDADMRRICLPQYRFAVEGPRKKLMAELEADEKRIAEEDAAAAQKKGAKEATMGIDLGLLCVFLPKMLRTDAYREFLA